MPSVKIMPVWVNESTHTLLKEFCQREHLSQRQAASVILDRALSTNATEAEALSIVCACLKKTENSGIKISFNNSPYKHEVLNESEM